MPLMQSTVNVHISKNVRILVKCQCDTDCHSLKVKVNSNDTSNFQLTIYVIAFYIVCLSYYVGLCRLVYNTSMERGLKVICKK